MLPPPTEDGAPLIVEVDISVSSIRSISLIDLVLSYDLTVTLKWNDPRLTFKNLKVLSYSHI